MSISEKLDAVVTTDTLNRIGEATVKAFGNAAELAKVGAECTIRYVWIDAIVGLGFGLGLLTLAAIMILLIFKFKDEDAAVPFIFIALVLIIFGVLFSAFSLPAAIEPRGWIVYKAMNKTN